MSLFPAFSWEAFGSIGDGIGGIIGTTIASIALIFTYKAFMEQVDSNKKQRKDISLERFESNLFNMLSLHEQITSSLRYINEDINPADNNVPEGRALFEFLYNRRSLGWHKGLKHSIEEAFSCDSERHEEYMEVIRSDRSFGCLDHYFAHLLSILNYIHHTKILDSIPKDSIAKKREYVRIVVSSISEYELIILFYYVLYFNSNHAGNFKRLIEEYAILETLRIDQLATKVERDYYKAIINNQDTSAFRPPTIKFGKGAFLFSNPATN